MKRRVLAVALALLLLVPLRSDAAVTVHDVIAWVQRALDYIEQLQQVQHQADQVRAAYKQLESYLDEGAWTDLHPLMYDLKDLYNRFERGENVGYLLADAEEMFRETFPGYLPPTLEEPAEFELRVDRATETLALITASLNLLARDNDDSVETLRSIQTASVAADGLLEELEVANMYQSHQAAELQKGTQAQMLAANAALVGAAFQIQQTASATAARRFWLESGPEVNPGEDPSEGFTGIPSSFRNLTIF